MRKLAVCLLGLTALLRSEIRPMTLRQAVTAALEQNPDIALARLDEEKARQAVRAARDPFLPRLAVGSGLAYSNGFPMSIEGSAPSVIQGQAAAYLFNRPQSFVVAEAQENVRGASISTTVKREEVAYRTASLYLDAERAARIGALAGKDAASLQTVLESVRAQVEEGRALPLAEKQAAYNVARVRALAASFEDDQASSETALALALGFPAEDRVRPVEEPRTPPALPESEEAAIAAAQKSSGDLRRLESQIAAKRLEIRGAKAERLPRADLVAQYAMLARFNNYAEFFQKFQRNNVQAGVSLQLPLLLGPGVSARVAQAAADISRYQIEYANLRNKISSDLQASFRQVKKADASAEVARLDLEVAREQLSVNLAQMQEGRAALRQVEESRVIENDKWIAFYDAQYSIERARWNLLRLTGELTGTIQALK
jgi:outer membrane protein TolC